LYLVLIGEFNDEDELKNSTKFFNAVIYVLSHPEIFQSRIRIVIRAAYEERFVLSAKQIEQLEKRDRIAAELDTEGDSVTEESDVN